jgi:thiol-disulfide isomerase/thioredoxin
MQKNRNNSKIQLNNMNKINSTILTSILIICGLNAQKGYEIKVKVNGIKDTTLILGHHLANSMYPDDTIRVDKNGKGIFKGKKVLPQGMYFIYLPTKKSFEIIVGENQVFSVENDTSNLFKKIEFSGSKENQIFYDYQYFLSDKRAEVTKLQAEKKIAKTDDEKNKVVEKMKSIDTDVRTYRNKLVNENVNSFVSKFIKATQDIDIPDAPKDISGRIIDSLYQIRYYRNHYLDNFDISDERMLRSPIYEEKILTYIDKVIPQIPDTIKKEVDKLILKSRTSELLFHYMLGTLFNHYIKSEIMGFDDVTVYIADKYWVKEAIWADTTSIKKIKEYIKKTTPLLLGKVAPDPQLVFVPTEHFIAASDSLPLKKNPYVGSFFHPSDIKKDYTILIFWEADCGHCKIKVPKLYEIYKKIRDKGVEIIAISELFGEEGKVKWVNFVNEHKLYDWINAWNPYDYQFKELFDIKSAPQIFILDKNKKIIAKNISPEQCEEVIDLYIEMAKSKK